MTTQMQIAFELAMKWHDGQKYGDYPYIVNLLEVDRNYVQMYMQGVENSNNTEHDSMRAIALLHDILEDTECCSLDLRNAGLNDRVVYAVECLSKIEGQPYNAYIDVVLCNPDSRKIKLCDTAANLSNSLKEMNGYRINKYTKQIQLLGGFHHERR